MDMSCSSGLRATYSIVTGMCFAGLLFYFSEMYVPLDTRSSKSKWAIVIGINVIWEQALAWLLVTPLLKLAYYPRLLCLPGSVEAGPFLSLFPVLANALSADSSILSRYSSNFLIGHVFDHFRSRNGIKFV